MEIQLERPGVIKPDTPSPSSSLSTNYCIYTRNIPEIRLNSIATCLRRRFYFPGSLRELSNNSWPS
jgi:hypothetical protein